MKQHDLARVIVGKTIQLLIMRAGLRMPDDGGFLHNLLIIVVEEILEKNK
jgi:hypothetical protein